MWTKDIEKNIRDRRVSGVVMQFEEEPLHNLPEDIEKAKALLQEALGSEWVTDDLNILIGYSRDQSPFPAQYTHLVCLPANTEEVSQVYKIANQCKVDVMPMGTGLTTMAIHIPLYGGILMDLRRMDQVLETDGANNFMRIMPGVNYLHAQVEAQKVGCRVLNPSTAATAAIISNHGFCNINTLASKYGFGIDNIIETTMVMPDGTIMKTGPGVYGANQVQMPGPGPDVSSFYRYAFGTLGTVTEMTLRIYPEQEFIYSIYPAYEPDRLDRIVEVLYKLANENLTLELAHMQDSFYGIFLGENNKAASAIADAMPRNNLFCIVSGMNEEEAMLKAAIVERVTLETEPEFQFMPPEAMADLTADLRSANLDRWQKFFNVTVRVMRVRGSFLIGALIGKLDKFPEIERAMRTATTDQRGHTDDVLNPDDASTYLQPYHMGRSAYMEYDLYSNQGDKDDVMATFITYMRVIMQALIKDGLAMACGLLAQTRGMALPIPDALGTIDDLMPMVMPNASAISDSFRDFKMAVDPNNIAARRWDYETGLCKKLVF
jgi:FAD/FMN-containing dehydrogenase